MSELPSSMNAAATLSGRSSGIIARQDGAAASRVLPGDVAMATQGTTFTPVDARSLGWLGTDPVPARPYYDPEWFELEREAVFRQQLAGGPDEISQALLALEQIATAIAQSHPGVQLYFDLGELRGYHYHTGAVFSAYVPGMGQAIAKGGRYDHIGEVFGRARPATGFSTDLRTLATFATRAQQVTGKDNILAPATEDAALEQLIRELRTQGKRVIRTLDGQTDAPAALGCSQQIVQHNGHWVVQAVS